MLQDFLYAVRSLRHRRWFAAAIIVTLALGIGVNTTVFTLVNAILYKPVPVPGGERLVTVRNQNVTRADSRFGHSLPELESLRQENRTFAAIEGSIGGRGILSENANPPERFSLARVTPGLLPMVKGNAVLGRDFTAADAAPGAPRVLLLGHAVWRNRYGGDPAVLGRVVRVDGHPATIIGVMPEDFKFPNGEDVWMPLERTADLEKRTNRPLQLVGILKPDTPIETAGADLARIAATWTRDFPEASKDITTRVRTFHDHYNGGPIRTVFFLMLGAVGFVLLIACANVANLMLSRAITRQREIGVRVALGASRWQIVRQVLTESVLLSVLGGLLGLGFAAAGVHWFDLSTRDVGKPYWIEFSMDYRVFLYFAVISIVSGLLFGLAPALRCSRVDLNSTLKDGTQGASGIRGGFLTAVLVVVQFALTVVLLTGAGLMMRSFHAAQTMNGFVPATQLFTARVSLPEGKDEKYAQRTDRIRFYDEIVERLAALPGVTHAAITSSPPGLGSGVGDIEVEGQPREADAPPQRAAMVIQSPGHLAAIGLPILEGRGFVSYDGETGKEAAVVTRDFARRYFANEPAVGRRFRFLEGNPRKPGPWITVVGVSGNIVQRPQDTENPPLVYLTYRQFGWGGMALLVRTAGDPAAIAAPVRAAVQALDVDLPLFDVRTMNAALGRSYWHLKVFGTLFFSFAVIALLMASVGLYAVVAHATGRRTREIGIRMALGATTGRIMQLVLSRGLKQLGIGLALGLGGAYAASLLLKNTRLIFQISPQDPLVFATVTFLLIVIGLAACWLPARRAARILPTQALRVD